MWSAPIDPRAWLAPAHALWLGPDGLWDHGPAPSRWLAAVRHQPAQRHASFEAWCQAHPGTGCRLVLSPWLLHELLLDPQLPLKDDQARLAYARSLLQHYHGDSATTWPLAAWQAGGRRGVSALHALALSDLQRSAQRARVTLRDIRPWWSVALGMACRRVAALAQAQPARLLVVDGTLITQIELDRGRVQALLQRRLGDARPQTLRDWHAELPAAACSVAMGHGLLAPWCARAQDSLRALGHMTGPAPMALWAGATSVGRTVTA